MPHDVTMPQLGMAQDAGKIVSWLKAPGDAVSRGDALFEVETDKATMEVEAQADGFLSRVTAAEGEDVPVGAVIARIADSAEDAADEGGAEEGAEEGGAKETGAKETGAADETGTLPEGRPVTMPQLGMAQDTGLLVSWLKTPGEAVGTDDILFEVETDKSTMEVAAGADGFLAATLAAAGEEVPVGETVAIISPGKPAAPVARSVKDAKPDTSAGPDTSAKPDTSARPAAAKASSSAASAGGSPAPSPARSAPARSARTASAPGGRVLASPKARRLARAAGVDLGALVARGATEPLLAADIDRMAAAETGPGGRRMTAEAPDGFTAFAAWAAGIGLEDQGALLAGLAVGALGRPDGLVAVTRRGETRYFQVAGRLLSHVSEAASARRPDLTIRDYRGLRLGMVALGEAATPTVSLGDAADRLTLTFECDPRDMSSDQCVAFLSAFAGRLDEPMRHLL